MSTTITARVQALSLGGAANPAIVTFGFEINGLIQTVAARVALYLRIVAQGVGVNSAIQQISFRNEFPSQPIVDIPFPAFDYANTWATLNPAYQAAISSTPSYGIFQLGEATAAAAPRGTSLCMTESSLATSSVGRHFLPDITRSAFEATTGDVTGPTRVILNQAWRGCFLGEQNSIFAVAQDPLVPGVWSRTTQQFLKTNDARCSVLGSLLQSRKR